MGPPARPWYYAWPPVRRFILPSLVVAAAVALLALLTYGVSNQGDNTSIDAKVANGAFPAAPSSRVALPVLGSNRTETLADFRGKVVVLNVFASWCQPCRAEAPILADEQKQIAGRDATILGVTYLDNSSDSEQFVKQEHVTYPVLRDVSGSFVRSFGATGVPETFVIDRKGDIEAVRRFQLVASWLHRTLPPVLEKRS
jgi:cytochrome c biogenesis protein CcmG, thiol:disulfide interchange protein DsbE